MPGNEAGDRVHNFFAEDSLSDQPLFANNQWVGRQGQIGALHFNPKYYNLHQSDNERSSSNDSLNVRNGLNLFQSTPQTQVQTQQSNLYGNYQRRQDEANFLGVDPESDQQNIASQGLSLYDSQQGSGSEQQTKTSARSETSKSPVSYDFFGSQQQMNHQQPGILHSLPRQQPGFSDTQQLQQEIIFRKMQEIQRQQQFWQLDARPEHAVNQMSPFSKQASSVHSAALTNGTPVSDVPNYSCSSEHAVGNPNWWQRGSSVILGSPTSGPISTPNHGQTRLTGMVSQQVNQSLYGVPVSSSKGSLNQYPHVALEKYSVQQMPNSSDSLSGNRYTVFPDQVSLQNGPLSSRQGFQGGDFYGHASGQGLDSRVNMENLQQVNVLQRNESFQEFHRRQDQAGPSETLQENPTIEASASHDSVALDPTEERILFGSDDNIWEAFGGNTSMSGGAGNLYGEGFLNGVPSLQSGSWSALMQSAVAETSSSDIGPLEEWSGLKVQNVDVPGRNQLPSTHNNSGKYQISTADDSFQAATSLDIGSVSLMNDANMNNNNVLGFQQFGHKFSHGLPANYSQSPVQEPSEGSKWLNQAVLQKSLVDGSQVYGKASRILDSKTNGKSIPSPRAPRNVGSSQLGDKPIDWNIIESVPSGGGTFSNIHESENSQINDQRRTVHGDLGYIDRGRETSSIPNSAHACLSVGGLQVNNEDFSSSRAAMIPNSGSTRANEETNEPLPNSQHLNYWKNVDPLVEAKGTEGFTNSQHLKKSIQDVDSSLNSFGMEEVRMHVKENANKTENSSDSYHSNLSNSASAVGLRGNVGSDVNDSRNLPGGKQKSSNRKVSGRKFQYHPMGNVDEDVDPSYGMRQATHLQAMSQQNFRGFNIHEAGHSGQSKVFNQIPNTLTELEKRKPPSLQGQTKDYGEAPYGGSHPGYSPNMSTSFKRPVGMHAMGNISQLRQNMPGVNNADQTKESGELLSNNLLSKGSIMEKSDGSAFHSQQSQLSSSQGFGLKLSPPSQRLPLPNHPLSSQSFIQTVKSNSTNHTPGLIREKAHEQFTPNVSSPSLSSVQTDTDASQYKIPGNLSSAYSSGFPHSKVQLQNQHKTSGIGEGSINHSMDMSLDRHTSDSKQINDSSRSKPLTGQSEELFLPCGAGKSLFDNPASGEISKAGSTNHPCERVSGSQVLAEESVSVSQPLPKSSVTEQSALVLPNLWSSGPAKQHSLGSQAHSLNLPHSHHSNAIESTSSASQILYGNINLAQKSNESQGKQYNIDHPSDTSPANSVLTHRDMEAFGRSLKPNNHFQQNFSLLNQMQAIRNLDPGIMGLKRLKTSDGGLSSQQVAALAGQSSESSSMVGDVSSHNHSYSDTTASIRVGQSQVSPQMAPSWFSQYGTLKNGQILPIYDSRKASIVKPQEQPFAKSSNGVHTLNSMEQLSDAVNTSEIGKVQISSDPATVAIEHFSSSKSLPQDVNGHNLEIQRPKKRKSSTFKLHPWCKEVSSSSQHLQTISVIEVEWANATNRLAEKVENDTEIIEDGLSLLRQKRRLVLTTQLMQQLFCPPLKNILSMDARSNYENVAYSVARRTLGNACSMVCCSRSESSVLCDATTIHSDKSKTSERIDDKHISKVVEDLLGRARKLEIDLLRLDKRTSILDLKVEYQDLEKFSIINRFARFHGRGQADGAEVSLSSDAIANHHKPFPQRYVAALPMPRTLPDRVQCLSL